MSSTLETGTRATVTHDGPLGVFALECWDAVTGRKLSRLWFDESFVLSRGMSGTIQGRDDSSGEDWYVVAFGDYVAPLHRSMFEPLEVGR